MPRSQVQDEAAQWIAWNEANYSEHGYGPWIVETHDGEFLGDCGLTWQEVNGRSELELGYHIRGEVQGRGYATEAAAACRNFARDELPAQQLVAIIHPDNASSVGWQKKSACNPSRTTTAARSPSGLCSECSWAPQRTSAFRSPNRQLIPRINHHRQLTIARWTAHNVRQHFAGVKHFHHPIVGAFHILFEAIELSADTGLSLYIYSPERGAPSDDAIRLLASWAATNGGCVGDD